MSTALVQTCHCGRPGTALVTRQTPSGNRFRVIACSLHARQMTDVLTVGRLGTGAEPPARLSVTKANAAAKTQVAA